MRVCGDNVHITISVGFDGAGESRVSARGRCVGADGGGGKEIFEEWKRNGGDCQGANLIPCVQSIIELFCCGKGVEIPWVAVVVAVLRIATD